MPKEEAKKDYPISRFLTSSVGKGIGSTLVTGGGMLAFRKFLRNKSTRQIAQKFGKNLRLEAGPTGKQIALTAGTSGGLSALLADSERDIYARAMRKKLESGRGGFTSQEKKLLGLKRVKGTGKSKGFSEHYVTPSTHGMGRAALALMFGGPSAALTEGLVGAVGTTLDRRLWPRALASRAKRGDKLTEQETRLLSRLGRGG